MAFAIVKEEVWEMSAPGHARFFRQLSNHPASNKIKCVDYLPGGMRDEQKGRLY